MTEERALECPTNYSDDGTNFISEDEIKQTRVLGPLQVEEASLLRALAHPEAADVRAPVQGAENQVRGQVHARQEG